MVKLSKFSLSERKKFRIPLFRPHGSIYLLSGTNRVVGGELSMSYFTLVSLGFIILAGATVLIYEYHQQIFKGIDWVRKRKETK